MGKADSSFLSPEFESIRSEWSKLVTKSIVLNLEYNSDKNFNLMQLKQTRFSKPIKKRRGTVIPPISTTTSTKSRNCPNPSQQQCPPLTENQRNSNCLKTCSKQVWKFTINSQKKTKFNYFHPVLRGDALQTFKNITGFNRENLGEFMIVFRRKNLKPQSMATAKYKFQRLVFNPAKQKEVNRFCRRTLESSERCFRSCRSGDDWTFHMYQNAYPHEENN